MITILRNMISFLFLGFLIANAYSQVIPSPCSQNSLGGLVTGLISLGAPSTQFSQAIFSRSLAGSNLGTQSEIFTAFALAGMHASSKQQFYSLIVDLITFSNGNTQMNVTMSYSSPDGNYQTLWRRIRLSYVLVSNAIQTITPFGGNYVWAGSVGLYAPFNNGLSGPVMPSYLWFSPTPGTDSTMECGYMNKSPPHFDTNCAGSPNPKFVTHLYIMGFQFDPQGGNYSLAASVLRNTGTQSINDLDEAQQSFTIKGFAGT
jgi:hypothetical protein